MIFWNGDIFNFWFFITRYVIVSVIADNNPVNIPNAIISRLLYSVLGIISGNVDVAVDGDDSIWFCDVLDVFWNELLDIR